MQAGVEAARDHLGHLEAAHPLPGHPVERLRLRPVAAQAELQEAVAADRARLDQTTHRRAVPEQRAPLGVPGVGVRVEVDDRHPAPADVPRHPCRVRQRDRVITAEDHRQRAGLAHLVHRLLETAQRGLGVPRGHLRVAGVHHRELGQRVDAERQVRPGSIVRQVVGAADRLRPEPRARPV